MSEVSGVIQPSYWGIRGPGKGYRHCHVFRANRRDRYEFETRLVIFDIGGSVEKNEDAGAGQVDTLDHHAEVASEHLPTCTNTLRTGKATAPPEVQIVIAPIDALHRLDARQ